MSSIFNSESWKKAVGTYKNNQSAQKPMMPAGAIGALSGVTTTPKPPQAAGLPPVAIKAANNVRSGITSVPSVPAAAKTAAQTMVATTSQPRTEQALSAQANLVNTPFSYNADSDPAYQAALRAAQQNLSVNQKNTNAQLRATGQGKSSYSETVANQLANQSAENVANNILPIYAQQAYQQYQDNIGNQRNLYQDYNQQDFQNPITEAATTGTYQNAATKNALDMVMMYKAAAEAPGVTAAQRAEYSKLADQQRAIIDANGGNSTQVGANINSKNVNRTAVGMRTLTGQQVDLQGKQANMDAATAVSNMTGKVITPQTDWQGLVRQAANPNTPLNASQGNFNRQQTFNEGQQGWNNQFDQAKFDEDTRRYGLDYALQQQQIAISQQNADTSSAGNSASMANSQFGQLMDIWQATGTAPSGLESYGVTPGTTYTAGAAAKAAEPKTYEDYQSAIEKVVKNNKKSPAVAQDYIKSLPVSNYEKYRAWIASGYEWPSTVEVPTPGE